MINNIDDIIIKIIADIAVVAITMVVIAVMDCRTVAK